MKCADCGFEYEKEGPCPHCGYDQSVDLVQAVKVENPPIFNGLEAEFSKICKDVEAGKLDQAKAKEYWSVVNNKAREGNRDARHLVGRVAVANKDYPTAHKIFARLADSGHALAQLDLGKMYEEGLGIEKDVFDAVKLYRLAAKQGNPIALMELAKQHHQGGCLKLDIDLSNAIMQTLAATHPTMFQRRGGCESCGPKGLTDAEFAKKTASQISKLIRFALLALIAAIVIAIIRASF